MRRSLYVIVLLVASAQAVSFARGRRPDDDEDKFPDYNRLEMHAKPKEPQTPIPEPASQPPSRGQRPPLNTPANSLPGDSDSDAPRPPPAVVPVPDGASEPPMPDDMIGTLIPSATAQSAAPNPDTH